MLYVFLTVVALGWLAPLLLAVYASLRPYQETAEVRLLLWPHKLSLRLLPAGVERRGDAAVLPQHALHRGPGGAADVLFFASFVAFALARFKMPGRKTLLVMFTAGNLLPPQVMVTPLYTAYTKIPLPEWMSSSLTLYDSYLGLIAIHVAFQTGFCVFVLYNYMQTIPVELTEAARGRRRRGLAAVLAGHPAADPAGPRRAGDAGVHLDLQRLPVGAGADDAAATSCRSPARSTICVVSSSPTTTSWRRAPSWWRCPR